MSFRLGLSQCCHPGDGNVRGLVERFANEARSDQVDLLAFPESLMTPYEHSVGRFLKDAQPADGPFAQSVDAVAKRFGLDMVYTLNELNPSGNPFNTAVVTSSSGTQLSRYRKVHLFDSSTTKESDRMSAGNELMRPVVLPYVTLGIGICYDLRFPEVARYAATQGAQLMLYPAAWVDGQRKLDQWRTLLKARAIENGMFVAGLSRCDKGYIGHSCVFDPFGELVAEGGDGERLIVAEIEIARISEARAAIPILDHRRPECYK